MRRTAEAQQGVRDGLLAGELVVHTQGVEEGTRAAPGAVLAQRGAERDCARALQHAGLDCAREDLRQAWKGVKGAEGTRGKIEESDIGESSASFFISISRSEHGERSSEEREGVERELAIWLRHRPIFRNQMRTSLSERSRQPHCAQRAPSRSRGGVCASGCPPREADHAGDAGCERSDGVSEDKVTFAEEAAARGHLADEGVGEEGELRDAGGGLRRRRGEGRVGWG